MFLLKPLIKRCLLVKENVFKHFYIRCYVDIVQTEVLKQLSCMGRLVVATGGDTVLQPTNWLVNCIIQCCYLSGLVFNLVIPQKIA